MTELDPVRAAQEVVRKNRQPTMDHVDAEVAQEWALLGARAMQAAGAGVRTEPLPFDIVILLKHAFDSGAKGTKWADYDVSDLAVYRRVAEACGILSALSPAGPQEDQQPSGETWGRAAREASAATPNMLVDAVNSELAKRQPTPAPVGDVAGLVAGLRVHIAALGIGCCSCGVKTFQPEYHDANCKVRNEAEALDNVDAIATTIEALQAEVAKVQAKYDRKRHAADEYEARATAAEAEAAALRVAAERYLRAVASLGEASGYNRLTYFETPILKAPTEEIGEECARRWLELNDAGKALRSALGKAESPADTKAGG